MVPGLLVKGQGHAGLRGQGRQRTAAVRSPAIRARSRRPGVALVSYVGRTRKKTEDPMRKTQCGIPNAEDPMRKTQCGIPNAEDPMRKTQCGRQGAASMISSSISNLIGGMAP